MLLEQPLAGRSGRAAQPHARFMRVPNTCLAAACISLAMLLHAAPARSQSLPGDGQRAGTVTGQILDESGAPVPGAHVRLATEDGTELDVISGPDGRFTCPNVPAGPYRLAVRAAGFATQTRTGSISPGETTAIDPIRLTLALGTIGVEVTPNRVEIADQQIKAQEHQRLLGIFPNFRVSYLPDAEPLNSRQKFHLTWKSVSDPTRFAVVGAAAGIQQARNDFSGFGPGVEGYAKRYAALYGTIFTSSMISNVLLPTVFKQDPRYFYKGTGSTSSRIGYALSRAVVRKGDNGRWQPDYSRILGNLASGAISNLYYPAEDRRGARLTLVNAALGIGGAAIGNVMQELLLSHITTRGRQAPGTVPPARGQ